MWLAGLMMVIMCYSSVHSTVSAVVSASLQPEDDATESTLTHALASADARPSTSAAVQTIGKLGLSFYFLAHDLFSKKSNSNCWIEFDPSSPFEGAYCNLQT